MVQGTENHKSQSRTALTRRGFVKGAAFVGALVAATATTGCAPKTAEVENATTQPQAPEEQVYMNTCHGNCGRNCAWDVTVREGYIVNAEPHVYDDDPMGMHRGGCSRGYLNVQRIYDEDRLKYPMKRVNSKDEDPEWEQITWDEAIDLIAEKWKAATDEYGPGAFGLYHAYGASTYLNGHPGGTWLRLLNATNCSLVATGADLASIWAMINDSAVAATTFDSITVNDNFIFWGCNGAETKWPAWKYVCQAREEKDVKIIAIDPQVTMTTMRADKHLIIKPATDGALALSVMQVMFENGWENAEFVRDRTCAPYLVKEDGTCLRKSDLGIKVEAGDPDEIYVWDTVSVSAKPISEVPNPENMATTGTFEVEGLTVRPSLDLLKERACAYPPEVASEITGISAEDIRELAEIIGTTRACIIKDNGHAHYKNSALTHLALDTLVMLQGNMGKPGAGIFMWYGSGPTNPDWLSTSTPGMTILDGGLTIPDSKLLELVETNKLGDNELHLKGLITYAGNMIGCSTDRAKNEAALKALDFVCVVEIRMTDTCKFADLLLPASHWWERDDVVNSGINSPYMRIGEKAVEASFECLSDNEIVSRLAEKLGVGEFFQGTDQDQLSAAFDSETNRELGCTYADLQEKKAVKTAPDNAVDPVDGSFGTENGRLNFFLDRPMPYVNYGQSLDPKEWNLPNFVANAEVLETSPLAERYPLVFITPHTKYGTQTTFHYTPWLHELLPEPYIYINPAAAQERGVVDGDYMRLYNDRGEVVAKAKYNNAVPVGMVLMYHGFAEEYFKKGHYQHLSTYECSDDFSNNSSFFDVRVQAEAYTED